MHQHYGLYEMAQDHQSQLLRDAGFDNPAAPHLAVFRSSQRAEMAANRLGVHRLNAAGMFGFARVALRGLARVRPGLSGV